MYNYAYENQGGTSVGSQESGSVTFGNYPYALSLGELGKSRIERQCFMSVSMANTGQVRPDNRVRGCRAQ